jgi:hypothetical protein
MAFICGKGEPVNGYLILDFEKKSGGFFGF